MEPIQFKYIAGFSLDNPVFTLWPYGTEPQGLRGIPLLDGNVADSVERITRSCHHFFEDENERYSQLLRCDFLTHYGERCRNG